MWRSKKKNLYPKPISLYSPETKEYMKAFGLVPSDQRQRELFNWTKADDLELATAQIEQRKRKLREAIAEGCSLREEMELEVQIGGWIRTRNAMESRDES